MTDIVATVLTKDLTAAGPGSVAADPACSNLTNSHDVKGFAEWTVRLPRAGKYRLHVRFTALESRPCTLAIGGVQQPAPILGEVTGGWQADTLQWFAYGPYDLVEGDNVLRIDFSASQPHLEQLAFSEVEAVTRPVLAVSGQYVEIADPFEDDTTFTLSLWAKTSILDDGGYHGLIGKQGDQHRKPSLWLCPGQGGIHYDSFDLAGQRYGELVPYFFARDRWTQITWVKRGTKYELYRDGRLFATKPAPERVYRAATSYYVGVVDNGWSGQIADVRVYRAALSPDEVAREMLSPSARDAGAPAASLSGEWRFDEGSGDRAADRSKNGNHGTFHGAAWATSAIPYDRPAVPKPAALDAPDPGAQLEAALSDQAARIAKLEEALAGAAGLADTVAQQGRAIAALQARLDDQATRIARLEDASAKGAPGARQAADNEERIADLEGRLAALHHHLAALAQDGAAQNLSYSLSYGWPFPVTVSVTAPAFTGWNGQRR